MDKDAKPFRSRDCTRVAAMLLPSSREGRRLMRTDMVKTVKIGELVVAAFDEASLWSSDPTEVSHLATRLVTHVLRRGQNKAHSTRPPAPPNGDIS